jgi:predicted nucleotidyltransferase
MKRTTVALSPATRDKLLDLKRQWRLATTEDVIVRMLEGQPFGARALYERNKKAVDAVLRRHGMKRLVAFGSRARGDARPDSDLDLVGDLPKRAGLFEVVHVKDELEAAMGVPVDFIPFTGVSSRLQAEIDREGVPLVG